MLGSISFLVSRPGIAMMGVLALSGSLVWGYQYKSKYLQAQNNLLRAERDYQARMADALDKQRQAMDVAIADERKRRRALETKWNSIRNSLKGKTDYDQSAPASIIHALNSLSDHATDR